MGVSQYCNIWRVAVTDITGHYHTHYFETEELADTFYEVINKKKLANANINKRSNAGAKDLPTGLFSRRATKKLASGKRTYNAIGSTVVEDGKQRTFTRTFGKTRPREHAIALVLAWRIRQLSR